jgi:hypothetical protein
LFVIATKSWSLMWNSLDLSCLLSANQSLLIAEINWLCINITSAILMWLIHLSKVNSECIMQATSAEGSLWHHIDQRGLFRALWSVLRSWYSFCHCMLCLVAASLVLRYLFPTHPTHVYSRGFYLYFVSTDLSVWLVPEVCLGRISRIVMAMISPLYYWLLLTLLRSCYGNTLCHQI